jgi:hypothetical protein
MLSYTKGAVDQAKKDGLYLIKVDLMGKYAKQGTAQFSGPVGPRTAKKLLKLFTALLANEAERMK